MRFILANLLVFTFGCDLWAGETKLIRELVYQAEVYERPDESLEALRTMLCQTPEPDVEVVRAMAIVKYPSRPRQRTGGVFFSQLERPKALLTFQNQSWLLVNQNWLELGDWVEDYYLLAMDHRHLLLETRDGFRREIRLEGMAPHGLAEDDHCTLAGAEAGLLLSFVSARAGLNWFIPTDLNQALSGFYAVPDWMTLLDRVCERAGISYTRRGESVVFHKGKGGQQSNVGVMDQRNVYLGRFLQELAENFDLEVILDERLADLTISFYAEEQPWDEILDCLAVAHDFSWQLVPHAREKSKLVVTLN